MTDADSIGEGDALRSGFAVDAATHASEAEPLEPRFDPQAPVLGRIAGLEVRLARGETEVQAAQRLRYHIFYEEMSAQPSHLQQATRLDGDRFDCVCDHLLVIDAENGGAIVGTYRLLLGERARLSGGFYTAGEFQIDELVARHPQKRFMELGRSCVLKTFRTKRVVELLWQGIWAYVNAHRVDVLFGCASLEGTDPASLAAPLAVLNEAAPAPDVWRVAAQPDRAAARNIGGETIVDARRVFASLPPLIKGYLRLGGYIGPDAVVDQQFGTTDILVVLPIENIKRRYLEHYGPDAARFAA